MNLPTCLKALLRFLHGPIYQRRIDTLVALLAPHLRTGDRVVDIGCGFGQLGHELQNAVGNERNVEVTGLEKSPRGDELINVVPYPGGRIPFEDRSFDVVIVADVLHHESDPERLLDECIRVSRRLLVIKDHQLHGFAAKWRVSFIDWAANAGYGVKCLFRYNTARQWRELTRRKSLEPVEELQSMNIYPPVVNFLFGGSLHYFLVAKVPAHSNGSQSQDQRA